MSKIKINQTNNTLSNFFCFIFLFLTMTSCDKKLNEKVYKSEDLIVSWYLLSDITFAHDYIELSKDNETEKVLKCHPGFIYDIIVRNDSVIIQSKPLPPFRKFKEKVFEYEIVLDTTITTYQWMLKYSPENAKYYKEETK